MQETDIKDTNKAPGAAPPAGSLERRKKSCLDSERQDPEMPLVYKTQRTVPRARFSGRSFARVGLGCVQRVRKRGSFHEYRRVWWLQVPQPAILCTEQSCLFDGGIPRSQGSQPPSHWECGTFKS